MVSTELVYRNGAADRWLRRWGIGLRLGPAAYVLLADRLRGRRRAGLVWIPAVVVIVASWVWLFTRAPGGATAAQVAAPSVTVAVVSLTHLVWVVLARRSDRIVGTRAPRRVARTGAVSARTVLGPVVWALLALAAAGQVAVGIVLVFAGSVVVTVLWSAALVAVVAVVTVSVRLVVARPTLAVDDGSLAVDERLRAQDAIAAVAPAWPFGWLLAPLLTSLPHAVTSVVLPVGAVTGVLGSLAWFGHPNERARRLRTQVPGRRAGEPAA